MNTNKMQWPTLLLNALCICTAGDCYSHVAKPNTAVCLQSQTSSVLIASKQPSKSQSGCLVSFDARTHLSSQA